MKTITVEVKVSGRLDEDNYESFDSERESMSIECIDKYDDNALAFLQDCMHSLGKLAVERWKQKREEFNSEK